MVGKPGITLTTTTGTLTSPMATGNLLPRPCPVAAANAAVTAAGSGPAGPRALTATDPGSGLAGEPNEDGKMPDPGWNAMRRLVPLAVALVTAGGPLTWPSPSLAENAIRLRAEPAGNGAPKPPFMLAAPRTDSMVSVAPGGGAVGIVYCSVKPVIRSG